MINIPQSLLKETSLTFTLDKTDFFAAITDPYFSIEANVNKIVFVYKSSVGHQRKKIEFLTSQEIPSDTVVFSSKANDLFNLEKIIMIDYDNGSIAISEKIVPIEKRTLSLSQGFSNQLYFAFSGTNDADLGGFDVGSFFN